MTDKIFVFGIVAGFAVAIGLAAVFSAILTPSTAQMMQHQGMDMGTMGQGMMTSGNVGFSQSGVFSGSGSSAVSNVQVTGIAVTGDNEVTVYLRYIGTGEAPSVVIVAHTNMMGMMTMMHGGSMGMGGMPMMTSGSSTFPTWSNTQWQQWHTQMTRQLGQLNSTQWQDWHTQMMMNPSWSNSTSTVPRYSSLQVGSTAVDAGWSNGSLKVRLEGAGTAYGSNDIMAMVFPLTS